MRLSGLFALLTLCAFALPARAMISEPAITYTPPGWPAALQADLYRPDGPGPFPVVLMVHGGGWRSGSRDEFYITNLCKGLVDAGYACFSASYRLAPAARYPAPLDDLRQALRWIHQQGPAHGLDPARTGAWGYSAGAHLVALLGTEPQTDSQAARLRAVVAGGTPADLRLWPNSEMVTGLIGQTLREAPERWAEASPVTHVSASSTPFYLYHGRLDTLVEPIQAESLAAALRQAGVPVELHFLEFSGHLLAGALPGAAATAGVAFLDRYLNSAHTAP